MKNKIILSSVVGVLLAFTALGKSAGAATTLQVGASGKTFASSAVQCAPNPTTGVQSPVVEAGLFNPTTKASATVSLNSALVATVTAANPVTNVWLADGDNTVVVALNRRTADTYALTVQPGMCDLPDTSGNTFTIDAYGNQLEYAASSKSYATVTPGCALNGKTGLVQPYVNLFDNGSYMLNVSVNGIPLTQLSKLKTHTPVFLGAGQNVISAANASLSIDYYVRDGGDGTCALP